MRLSAPIHRLKQRAKALARDEDIPLNRALNRIARQEGFDNWSLLAARTAKVGPNGALLEQLIPGDQVLLAARRGHGKTLMGLRLILETLKQGRTGAFFTLEYTATDVFDRLRTIGANPSLFEERFMFDDSDCISGGYICNRLADAPHGTIAVVDYLQLLDQKRDNPELSVQVQTLKSFAQTRGLIIVMISQISRSFERSARPHPGLDDVRLPNPLDLGLFSKACFLNNGSMQIVPAQHG
ncbi:MAG: DNA helicase [Alphaproteobacteria bacterium]|nr:DNA helicase [Alphaproteobacteria bacterium]